jgi:16S rRNA (guanine(1405)-N(7))-methyltransferase
MSDMPLDAVIAAVRQSSKYRNITVEVIATIAERELQHASSLKAAIKATKNTLHQIGGAYQEGQAHYDTWLSSLVEASEPLVRRDVIRAIARQHISMRERLPILDELYSWIFAQLPPVSSVLDIACGLHPLALPWMPLATTVSYHACDIYEDLIAFIGKWLPLSGHTGTAWACDVTRPQAFPEVDVAFLLKALPCLEQIDPTAGTRILEKIRAQWLVVSFPAQTLGGHHKGMTTTYSVRFERQIATTSWQILAQRQYATELIYLLRGRGSS